jgi:lysozyme
VKLGPAGIALIQSFEKCRLTAYDDGGGVPTIGWGHTRGVKMGDTCTQEQADAWFIEDTQTAVDANNAGITRTVTQHQFDALVSFAFNVGIGAESHSTLLRLVNLGRANCAAEEFAKWDHQNGVVVPGLDARRAAEKALFLLP